MSKLMKQLLVGPYGGRIKDYYKDGEGYHDVLMQGFCDDYCIGLHCIIDRDVSEVIKRVKRATPCTCEECAKIQQAK